MSLGLFWLVDGLLELQPADRSRAFAAGLTGGAMGQPAWVQWIVLHVAAGFGAHPLGGDLVLAVVEVALGAAILVPRTRLAGLVASVPWALAVWVLGEGLGNIATGFAMVPTGAPGAGLCLAVVAAVLLAKRHATAARIAAVAWAALWWGGAVLQVIPVGTLGFKLSANFQMASLGEPRPLAALDSAGHGPSLTLGLVALELAAGAAVLVTGPTRALLAGLGITAAAVFWVVGENLAELLTGGAVDLGTMPCYVLLGAAFLIAGREKSADAREPTPARMERHPRTGHR
jgi:hypothetical protein